jgi:hypothetical protein
VIGQGITRDGSGEARTIFGEIYKWFTEGVDTAALNDAKALLGELGYREETT